MVCVGYNIYMLSHGLKFVQQYSYIFIQITLNLYMYIITCEVQSE